VTGQWLDLVHFDETLFDLSGARGKPLFEPAEFGLVPMMINTACFRGYVCTYAVRAGQLIVTELLVGEECLLNKEKVTEHSLLCGIAPQPSWPEGTLRFSGLDIPVAFSGGLLLGGGFVDAFHVDTRLHPALKYQRVTEILLEDGRLTGSYDRSAEAARIRQAIENGELSDPAGGQQGTDWLRRAFALDYGLVYGYM
jgi:hypothetical protein